MTTGTVSLIPPAIIRSTPDWRWQWVASVPYLVSSNIPVSETEVPDEIIRCRLLPFCRRCYGLPVDMPEDGYQELRRAHSAYTEKWSYRETALVYEACALAYVYHDGGGDLDPVQRAYEDIFFDIRYCWDDIGAVVTLVFEPMLADLPLCAREFENKVVAYTLGNEHLQRWLRYDDSTEILALRARLTQLDAFRTSLADLRLPVTPAWSKALCQIIRLQKNKPSPAKQAGFLDAPDWRERMQNLIDDASTLS